MSDTKSKVIAIAPQHDARRRRLSESKLAAVVQAAYILQAVRQ